ncbi:hypothetical protein P3T73_00700 [Kiritimatiellota bacterium B12222]|nr:hypothetical protein P3T73_00700 [Kiritimatiellota bacterium B12222]
MISRKRFCTPSLIFSSFCGLLLLTSCGPGPTQSMFNNEGSAIGNELGDVLREREPRLKVLVMTRPGLKVSPLDDAEKAIIQGIEKALGRNVKTAEIVPSQDFEAKVKKQNLAGKERKMALQFEYQTYVSGFPLADLISFMETHKSKADVIVNMMGTPHGLTVENFPQEPGLPGLVIINSKVNEALTFLNHQKGWAYHVVRPQNPLPANPDIQSVNVGRFSTILYPTSTN